ncbi:chitinase-3-like protein 1 [Elysia marginata]|uniref:Chitinase-3-like protein 1 n=1 Tax=Elysia marginata TaxID=1093978 RepID=A0AAV4J4L6_9GAST|nr:chitinase-3-like protein 1 [Elysia marginata]
MTFEGKATDWTHQAQNVNTLSFAPTVDTADDSDKHGGSSTDVPRQMLQETLKLKKKVPKIRGRSALSFSKSTVASRNKLSSRSACSVSGRLPVSGNSRKSATKSPNWIHNLEKSGILTRELIRALSQKRHRNIYHNLSHRDMHILTVHSGEVNRDSPSGKIKSSQNAVKTKLTKDGEIITHWSSDEDDSTKVGKRGEYSQIIRNIRSLYVARSKNACKEKHSSPFSYSGQPFYYSGPSPRKVRRTYDMADGEIPNPKSGEVKTSEQIEAKDYNEQNKSTLSYEITSSRSTNASNINKQASCGEGEIESKSGSAYTTTTTDNRQEGTTPSQLSHSGKDDTRSDNCGWDKSYSCRDGRDKSYSCRDGRDFRTESRHAPAYPEDVCIFREIHESEDTDAASLFSVIPKAYLHKVLNYPKCIRTKRLSKDYRLPINEGAYEERCRTFQRLPANANSNKSPFKRNYNILKVFPQNPVHHASSRYRKVYDAEGVIKPVKNKTNTRKDHRQSNVETDNETKHRTDLNSQLQSLIEYQVLLSENIQYLNNQLDHVVSQLPQGSVALTNEMSSKSKPWASSHLPKTSQPYDLVKENSLDAALKTLQRMKTSSTALPTHAHKAQQTECTLSDRKSIATNTFANFPSTLEHSRSPQSAPFDTAEKAALKTNPTSSKATNCLQAVHPCPVLSVNQPKSQEPNDRKCASLYEDDISTPAAQTEGISQKANSFSVSDTNSHDLQYSPMRLTELLQEMEVWKEKLTHLASLNGNILKPNAMQRSVGDGTFIERTPSKSFITTRYFPTQTHGDKNWSSCLSGDKSESLEQKRCKSRCEDLSYSTCKADKTYMEQKKETNEVYGEREGFPPLKSPTLLTQSESAFRRVCYFTNWSCDLLEPEAHFCLRHIDPRLCTHFVYAFAQIDPAAFTLTSTRGDDEDTDKVKGRYRQFNKLIKGSSQKAKTLLSIGGLNQTEPSFNVVARTARTRTLFAQHCAVYLRRWGFDGLDVDWEYPQKVDRELLSSLLTVSKTH